MMTEISEDLIAAQSSLYHPAHQVYFRAGVLACREEIAKQIEKHNKQAADLIRKIWWNDLGEDPGVPRQFDWSELTEGEYGTESFRCKNADEVSASLEAMTIAHRFLCEQCS